ncbi:MAG: hypothetical protein WBB25_01070 [Sulfitobacter sp.]
MDITLHIGAHRSATTSFQYYLRDNHDALNAIGTGYWGPQRMRGGMVAGLFPGLSIARGRNLVRRAQGRVQMNLARARRDGVEHLLVSDENMPGTMRSSMRAKTLYPAIGERMARYHAAFGGQVTRVVMSVRAQDLWWSSAAAYTVARGHPVPGPLSFEMISQSNRTWRDVITDLACAVPDAEIIVGPFEQFAGQPQSLLQAATKCSAPLDQAGHWRNRTPDLPALRRIVAEQGNDPAQLPDTTGRWHPFTPEQSARLRENYADDLHWLTAGADGLATLALDPTRTKTGNSLQAGALTKGRTDDSRQKNMARTG